MILTLDRDKLEKGLILKGVTQTDIAEETRLSKQTISKVFCGHNTHPPTIRKIAEALGLKSEDVWIDGDAA